MDIKGREILTIKQAAERVSVGRRTIYNWIKDGKLKYVLTPGGHRRIFSDSLLCQPLNGKSRK